MDIRWKQRFQNFEKAHTNLIEMLELFRNEPSNKAYKLATIQSYEMSIELGWKTLKDYLNYLGHNVQSPRESIKQAFAIDIIKDGEIWLFMLEDRNLTSHVYDEAKAMEVLTAIDKKYFNQLNELFIFFKGKLND